MYEDDFIYLNFLEAKLKRIKIEKEMKKYKKKKIEELNSEEKITIDKMITIFKEIEKEDK